MHIVTGGQIERLHFFELKSAFRVRARVLRRLTDIGALVAMPRRVGGPDGGSGPYVYGLDPAAILLLRLRENTEETARIPAGITRAPRLQSHALAVSELYTRLAETSRDSAYQITEFQAEPDCWWPDGTGSHLKPDAYTALVAEQFTDHWWIEVDLGTESVPVIRAKFAAYTAFAQAGIPGPGEVIPRVLVTTPDSARCAALKRALSSFPDIAGKVIHIVTFDAAVPTLAAQITTPIPQKGHPNQ
ncbi:replication-relaxation family protein [Actinomadura craniellae]|uniref:replication-relaxation family protein n=1 Tax=Actinomadura craniellae TaxID=2231787 RepID=UPI001313F91C|nr:replication-relaxation family protein [Actinomadura craniellae]